MPCRWYGGIPACLATGFWGECALGGSAPRGCVPGLGRSTPRGCVPGWGGLLPGVPGRGVYSGGLGGRGIPVCTEADPTPPQERRLLLRMVRIPLECILVVFVCFPF